MENSDMRNMILSELIDKMHGRMADKMFPPDPSLDDKPAVEGLTQDPTTAEGMDIPAENPPAAEDEPSDEDIDELLG